MDNNAFEEELGLRKVIKSEGKPETETDLPKTASEAFDIILNAVGGYGKWQWKLVFIAGFCGIFTSLHNFGAVFLAANSDHWCKIPSLKVNKTTSELLRNYTIPWEKNKNGETSNSKCSYYDIDYNNVTDFDEIENFINSQGNLKKVNCDDWYYDTSVYKSTVVSEWNLVCERRYLMSAVQATYMFGILMGAVVFSAISDKIGRRPASLICTIIFFLSSSTAGLSNTLGLFMFLRFLTAAAGQGMYLINFILSMEVVVQKGRTVIPLFYGLFFLVGSCLLPVSAYFIRNWRDLQFTIGIPTFFLFFYYWILPESPRWLVMQGRIDEALYILNHIAKTNGGSLPPKPILDKYLHIISEESYKRNQEKGFRKLIELAQNIWDLVRTPNLRKRSCIIFYAWFVVSSVYYGLTFSGYNLNISTYLLVFCMSFAGIPLLFIKIPFFIKFGRRIPTVLAFSLCAASCLGLLAVPHDYLWISLLLTVLGRQMAGVGFAGAFIYSSELVPTNIRNISMGIGSMWGRIGSIISPFIVDLLGEVYYLGPSTLFGAMALLAAILCLFLPETGFSNLPESIEEIEATPR